MLMLTIALHSPAADKLVAVRVHHKVAVVVVQLQCQAHTTEHVFGGETQPNSGIKSECCQEWRWFFGVSSVQNVRKLLRRGGTKLV
jgi:hypothetical protein